MTPDITQEDRERARELRRELRPVLRWSDHADTCDCCQAADDIIAAALAAARAEALEQAAQVVDQCNREGPYMAFAAAKRIRALIGDGNG